MYNYPILNLINSIIAKNVSYNSIRFIELSAELKVLEDILANNSGEYLQINKIKKEFPVYQTELIEALKDTQIIKYYENQQQA